ncbi:hypothetical protein RRG08_035721 [Elysia crispata]|uniref:Uncharacterized protein n=1 Tax=Elysia crispata TaxID=231223 RepID=A0AAE1D015_9GAST|nr:hypothetical protein RRG08_035721 [Elysia crispata]
MQALEYRGQGVVRICYCLLERLRNGHTPVNGQLDGRWDETDKKIEIVNNGSRRDNTPLEIGEDERRGGESVKGGCLPCGHHCAMSGRSPPALDKNHRNLESVAEESGPPPLTQ